VGTRSARGLAALIAAAALLAGCGGGHKPAAAVPVSTTASATAPPSMATGSAAPSPVGAAPTTAPAPAVAPTTTPVGTAAAAGTPVATVPTPVPTDSTGPPPIPDSIVLTSPDFKNGGTIPAVNTCAGSGRMPTLVYDGVPESSELIVTVVDRDAPGGSFVHWLVYGIPATSTQGSFPTGHFPAGTLYGRNSAGKDGWTPPCPPKGSRPHHYVFTLYSIGSPTGLKRGASAAAVQKQIDAGAVARGKLTGTFARK
jgi:Raf kinase inhibitor-like YbhB/YbcL family protein